MLIIPNNVNLKTKPKKDKFIRLDHNENPLGASPLAIDAARKALVDCHRYPNNHISILKANLATHLGILPHAITLGNGSEALLELIARTYLTPKDSAVLPQYSFTGITRIIENTGAKLRIAMNTYEHTSTLEILAAIHPSTKVIFIINPNNPTGTYIHNTDLKDLLDKLPSEILIVIDEAYIEYVEEDNYYTAVNLLADYPNLIVIRTFSKFYGLAGLRLGYAISQSEITSHLQLNCLPFTVNSIALAAAQAAIGDYGHRHLTRITNQQGRNQLIQGLKDLSLTIIPSHTNFVCVDLKQTSFPIYNLLLNAGVKVRPLHDYGMPSHLRVSIGLKEENHYFLETLGKILTK